MNFRKTPFYVKYGTFVTASRLSDPNSIPRARESMPIKNFPLITFVAPISGGSKSAVRLGMMVNHDNQIVGTSIHTICADSKANTIYYNRAEASIRSAKFIYSYKMS